MTTTLDFLIPELRLTIGDTDSTAYRYTDAWLLVSLIASVKELGRWWRYKYLIDTSGNVSRSPYYIFNFVEPPVIESYDERIIILMASIIILQGSLENSAWDLASWKDAEISHSNLESGRIRSGILTRLWDELNSLLKPPTKRLAVTKGAPLPGFRSDFERDKNP